MTLSPGTHLGAYEIIGALGAGGMGEVYRARDTKLNRDVALKILASEFALDPDRLARFRREAQLLASLNHPNIGAIHGFEESSGLPALVLELVEGPTLADRIARGAIPVSEALPIARQIAEALEAAHEQGIVHRDLKPANIKIRDDGTVKVLDFGLAKALEPASTGTASRTMSPTITTPAMTMAGVILGTAAYMSPEQAKGLAADHRSDVFSFGCVLYEMLTGRQPFQGDSVPDVLASILIREPDFTLLPANLNPRVRELLQRCFEKQPKRRWQAIGDVRAELEIITLSPTVSRAAHVATYRPTWKYAAAVAVMALFAASVAFVIGVRLDRTSAPDVVRLSISLADAQFFPPYLGAGGGSSRRVLDISPDGKTIVYAARSGSSGSAVNQQLYVRAISQFESRPLAASETNTLQQPMFSPDGQSIAFFAMSERTLKRVAISGGPATTVAPFSGAPAGASWSPEGILIGAVRAVQRIGLGGGPAETLVALNQDEIAFQPEMLPGGRAVMFTLANLAGAIDLTTARVVVQPLPSGERKTVAEGASDARYLPTGHVVYAVGSVLYARRFDLNRLEASGAPVPIVEGIDRGGGNVGAAAAQYAVSSTGTLIYIPGPALSGSPQRNLLSIDHEGKATPLKVRAALYDSPRISPDGSRIAVVAELAGRANVYVYDLAGGTTMRQLTFDGRNRFPVWTPDGKRIVFQSNRAGDLGIWWQQADGTGVAERLTTAENGSAHIPESFLPHTNTFSFSVVDSTGAATLRLFSLERRKAEPFGDLRSSYKFDSEFSPDGHWIAYTLRGKDAGIGAAANVWVQPVPPTGTKYLVSTPGGHHPQWSPDGTRLMYFPFEDPLVSVPVNTRNGFEVGDPTPVPGGFRSNTSPQTGRNHDIAPAGSFIIVALPVGATESASPRSQRIDVVLNWLEELKARVPGK